MKIIKIVSEWKKLAKNKPANMKRVEAIVEINGQITTRHIDIPK